MSFEIQELTDIIRIIVLMNLSKERSTQKSSLKDHIDKVCTNHLCVDTRDVDVALEEMTAEGLISSKDNQVQPTEQGLKLGREWRNLLLKKEPIIEIVAGITDGSITGLVVVLSAFIAPGMPLRFVAFAAFLTLTAVAITNFSSFLLGGITEDLADMMTLQTLMNYSLSDIPDKKERDKSLMLVKRLFTVLHKEISRSNILAAISCGITTFIAGFIPMAAFLALPSPFNIILSLSVVAAVVGIFLVRYRSKRTKVHWKITLLETVAIVLVATIASLIVSGIA